MPVEKIDSEVLSKEQVPFDLISRSAIDGLQSADAIALFVVMAGRPEGWVFRKEWIKQRLGFGEHRYRQAMSALESAGYVSYEVVRGDGGQISGRRIWFRQVVTEASISRASVEPSLGESTPLENREDYSYSVPLENREKKIDQFPDFDRFWALYPRRIAKSKAFARWRRMSKADRAAALEHLERRPYADRDKEFIPHPTTYLYQERWVDESDPGPEDLPLIGI